MLHLVIRSQQDSLNYSSAFPCLSCSWESWRMHSFHSIRYPPPVSLWCFLTTSLRLNFLVGSPIKNAGVFSIYPIWRHVMSVCPTTCDINFYYLIYLPSVPFLQYKVTIYPFVSHILEDDIPIFSNILYFIKLSPTGYSTHWWPLCISSTTMMVTWFICLF